MLTREQIAKIIARDVKAARKELGVTETQLAGMAGLCPGTIKRAESGECVPNTQTICKLAEAFYCEPADLIPDKSELRMRKHEIHRASRSSVSGVRKRRRSADSSGSELSLN